MAASPARANQGEAKVRTAARPSSRLKTASRLMGERFVRGYLAVKTLEHDHYLREISAWERRYLLPQV